MKQREIKFRGKRTDTKSWVYGHYFKTPLTDENSGTQPDAGWFFLNGETRHCISEQHGVAFTIMPETVGQFTGLKDKNGKDIYEGDVVRIDNLERTFKNSQPEVDWKILEIKWNRYTWAYNNSVLYLPMSDYDLSSAKPFDIEIIGNIYENPELLK